MSPELTIPSSLFLTILIIIGLLFFIRASVKDRIESKAISLQLSPPDALEYLVKHFQGRNYKLTQQNPDTQTVVMEGFVSPSLFLCAFLMVLGAIGFFSLGLVLTIAVPLANENAWYALVMLTPFVGLFYWRGAARSETIQIQPQSIEAETTIATVTGHRDELKVLTNTLAQQP